jgi:hypothetical protein
MEYAARLINARSVLVPAIALVIGAGGAVGVYAAVDDTDVQLQPTRVVVADPPAPPSDGVLAKDEAAAAAAIGADEPRRGGGPAAENDDTANRTDPHGPAAALP